MSKVILSIILLVCSFVVYTPDTFAAGCDTATTVPSVLIKGVAPLSTSVPEDQRWVKFRIPVTDTAATYKVIFSGGFAGIGAVERDNLRAGLDNILVQANGDLPGLQYNPSAGGDVLSPGTHQYIVEKKGVGNFCSKSYTIAKDNSGGIQSCDLQAQPPTPDETQRVIISGKVLPQGDYAIWVSDSKTTKISVASDGTISPVDIGQFNPGEHDIYIQSKQLDTTGSTLGGGTPVYAYKNTNCKYHMTIAEAGKTGSFTSTGTSSTSSIDCKADPTSCTSAAGVPCTGGLQTAIGCVPTDPTELIPKLLKLATAAGGGIALLLMISGAFQMITSAGNPDSLKAGQGRFTSAIVGLLFVIFSVLLLQIIGVSILDIPGFK